MKKLEVKVTHLVDNWDCYDCGCTMEEGWKVVSPTHPELDVTMTPSAFCYDGEGYTVGNLIKHWMSKGIVPEGIDTSDLPFHDYEFLPLVVPEAFKDTTYMLDGEEFTDHEQQTCDAGLIQEFLSKVYKLPVNLVTSSKDISTNFNEELEVI